MPSLWDMFSKTSLVNGDDDPEEEDEADAVAGGEGCPGFKRMEAVSEPGNA